MNTTVSINNTTVQLLRRTFARFDKATAIALFTQVLETPDDSEGFQTVDSLVEEVLTERNGVLIHSADLLAMIKPQVGEAVESEKRLNSIFKDVLAQSKYESVKGPHGGAKLASVATVSQAKPKAPKAAAKKGFTLQVPAAAAEVEVSTDDLA